VPASCAQQERHRPAACVVVEKRDLADGGDMTVHQVTVERVTYLKGSLEIHPIPDGAFGERASPGRFGRDISAEPAVTNRCSRQAHAADAH